MRLLGLAAFAASVAPERGWCFISSRPSLAPIGGFRSPSSSLFVLSEPEQAASKTQQLPKANGVLKPKFQAKNTKELSKLEVLKVESNSLTEPLLSVSDPTRRLALKLR